MFIILLLLKYFTISLSLWHCEAIIGGTDAIQGEFPFVVSLRNDTGRHYCGGALITNRHVLTAAHCLYSDNSVFGAGVEEKLPPQNVTVSINTISLDQNSGQVYQVEKLTHHPQYNIQNFNTAEYDVAIIKLKSDVAITGVTVIERLDRTPVGGEKATVAGWGVNKRELIDAKTPANTLQKIELDIIDVNQCISQENNFSKGLGDFIEEPAKKMSLFCAWKDASAGICVRDSGSPLIIDGKIAGIVSFGVPCAKGVPDVFQSVNYYSNFINEEIAK